MSNVAQRSASAKRWEKADALEPGKHEMNRRSSPVSETIRCSCGWSTTQRKPQNALGREAKLTSAVRQHAEEIIARHP
jgi:hypothetical protein